MVRSRWCSVCGKCPQPRVRTSCASVTAWSRPPQRRRGRSVGPRRLFRPPTRFPDMPTAAVPTDMRPSGGSLAIDVQLLTDLSATKGRAEQLAEVGVDGLFTFEGQHDVFFPLVLAADSGLDLMTNVAIAFPRSPMHLANSAYDLAALSGGRFRLGLGTQIRPHIERRYGATWSRPVARMREIVLATKAILTHWQGEAPLEFRGEFFTHTLMTPNFNPGPLPTGTPPIHVGALGPQMTRMTASVADGVLVMPFNSRRHLLERAVPALQ